MTILLVALVATAAIGLWGWRVITRAQSFIARLDDLAAAASDMDVRRWPEVCPRLALTAAAAADLRQAGGPALPLAARLAPRPYAGDLAASGPLLDAAVSLGAAGEAACAALTVLSAPPEPGLSAPEAAVSRLAAARPSLAAARAEIDRANALLGQIDAAALSPTAGARVSQVRALLPLARDGVDLAMALPGLLGADGRRVYLVVAQNPDELRPTGGFISAAGLLTIEGGRIVSLDLEDSALVDDFAGGPYPLAPEPMRRYMVAPAMAPGIWAFRDANWSPDFPTSARAMLDLYRRGKGAAPDGVVAFTPETIRLLLAALGPVAVEASSEPVSAQNLDTYIHTVWSEASAQGRGAERKESLSRLAEALLMRLRERPDLSLTLVERALQLALDQRDLAMYLPGSPAADLLASRGWDGALHTGDGDFLMVASANVGYNKVGPHIEQRLTYAVDLSDPTAPRGAVTVTDINSSAGEPGCRPLERVGLRYEDLVVGCYWSYVRVYVAGAASLIEYRVPEIPDSWMLNGNGDHGRIYSEPGEAGTHVFGALVVVPRQSEHRLTFRYDLAPSAVIRQGGQYRYRLRIRRQPGLRQRASIQVLLPPGASLDWSSQPALPKGGQVFAFELPLATDASLELLFQEH